MQVIGAIRPKALSRHSAWWDGPGAAAGYRQLYNHQAPRLIGNHVVPERECWILQCYSLKYASSISVGSRCCESEGRASARPKVWIRQRVSLQESLIARSRFCLPNRRALPFSEHEGRTG